MSGWLVVAVDGTLTHRTGTPTAQLIREAIGDDADRVGLPPGLAGWVDGDGHPKRLPRNEVGSVLLMALGAGHQPYAGPVVITGWHRVMEITELDHDTEWYVRTVHDRIRYALGGGVDGHGFADAARETAAAVREAETPTLRVIPLGGRS